MQRHVPKLYDWAKPKPDQDHVLRCAILDVVPWFLGVLQQLWTDVSVRCPQAERYNDSASKPGAAAEREAKRRRHSDMVLLCAPWFLKHMADWTVRASSCCVIW